MINNLKPLAPYEIRDIEREIEERLNGLRILESLVIVKSFKKGKCYGIGLSDPKKDLILRNFARLMVSMFTPYNYGASGIIVVLVEVGGASKNVQSWKGSGTWDYPLPTTPSGTRLGFGNPATTPTPARTDYQIASLVSYIVPSSTLLDEVYWRVITTGSYVWASGGTVRCAGKYITLDDNVPSLQTVLMYYDAVSDVVVPAGGTVSVTYKTQL